MGGFDNIRFRSEKNLEAAGYQPLAGPYRRKEEEMLDRAVADARRANKTVAFSGDMTRVEVWQKSNLI